MFRTQQLKCAISLRSVSLTILAATVISLGLPLSSLSACVTANVGGNWVNNSFSNQTGTFTATYDSTPTSGAANSVVGLSSGSQTAYSGFACLTRFNPTGQIDARNGGAYQAASTINYSANVSYHFRLVVNIVSHTYSIFVTPSGGSELAVGSNYAFRTEQNTVTNLNNWGVIVDPSGSGSNTVCNFAVAGSGAPAAPTGLTATAGNTQVSLSWTASSGATSYNVYRGTSSGGESGTSIATGITNTSYTNTGLTNGTTYYYKVAAVNSFGTSGLSNEASATPTSGVPPPPTGLSVVPGNAQVVLNWSASGGATSYNVYRGASSGGESLLTAGIVSTSYTNTGLTNGTTYYYKVAAVNSSGTSGLSNEAGATPNSGWNSNVGFGGSQISLGAGHTGLQNIEFDVTPSANNFDGVIGYAGGSTNITSYSSMSMMVHMNTNGTFDVMNGSTFQATTSFGYTAGNTYHVKIVVQIGLGTYNVWVNQPNGPQVEIASNYSLQTGAPAMNDVGKVYLVTTDSRSFTVTNHAMATLDAVPTTASVLNAINLVDTHWINANPGGGSNGWDSATLHMGNLACYLATNNSTYYNYTYTHAVSLNWLLNNGTLTTNADLQCLGSVYSVLYQIAPVASKLTNTKANFDAMVNSSQVNYWTWVDAIHMSMPVFTKMGVIYNDTSYFNKMYQLYSYPRNTLGLYDTTSHLWYRDGSFTYPQHTTPNGQKIFWSRGNGWAFAALTHVLAELPNTDPHYGEYESTYMDMAAALVSRQRVDGFWNVSLDDPNDFPGDETSGTAAFTYGLAWGVNNGILDPAVYKPVATKAWNGLVASAVLSNGTLGWVQPAGAKPADGQPVLRTSTANYGVGLFLSAGSEVLKYSTP